MSHEAAGRVVVFVVLELWILVAPSVSADKRSYNNMDPHPYSTPNHR